MAAPKLTKPQRRLLLALARDTDHRKYPHRHDRLPVKGLVALGYVATQRWNGSYSVALTEAGFDRACALQNHAVAQFERWDRKSRAVGCGGWPDCLRPQRLAPWKGVEGV